MPAPGGILDFDLIGLFAGPIVLAMAWAVWKECARNWMNRKQENMNKHE